MTDISSTDALYLVTGANGYIAAHACDQLLKQGHRVRGTVRNIAKNGWLQEHFDHAYGQNRFELVQIEDLTEDGCFDNAISGCTGFANVAGDVSFVDDPELVIPAAIRSIKNALAACDKESAKENSKFTRFVYLSSSHAVRTRKTGVVQHIDASSWNEEAVQRVLGPQAESAAPLVTKDPKAPQSIYDGIAIAIYSAAKVLSEKEVWKHVSQQGDKLPYTVNALIPNFNIGGTVHLKQVQEPGKPVSVMRLMFEGLIAGNAHMQDSVIPPQRFCPVSDTGRLLTALLTRPDVSNERVIAMSQSFNSNDFINILLDIRPQHTDKMRPLLLDNPPRDLSEVDCSRAEGLLRDMKDGKEGFQSLHAAVTELLESLGV